MFNLTWCRLAAARCRTGEVLDHEIVKRLTQGDAWALVHGVAAQMPDPCFRWQGSAFGRAAGPLLAGISLGIIAGFIAPRDFDDLRFQDFSFWRNQRKRTEREEHFNAAQKLCDAILWRTFGLGRSGSA